METIEIFCDLINLTKGFVCILMSTFMQAVDDNEADRAQGLLLVCNHNNQHQQEQARARFYYQLSVNNRCELEGDKAKQAMVSR